MTKEADEDQAERDHRAAHWAPYRAHMVAADQKAQEDFDKTVLSLSGGGLGISFVFLKDVIGANPVDSPALLLSAWATWGASTLCVLLSYYLSHLAIRKIIRQIDKDTLHREKPGGRLRDATAILNGAGALLFVAGVVFITLFAQANLKEGRTSIVRPEGKPTTATATATATATSTASSSSSASSSAASAASGSRTGVAAPER